MGLREDDMEVRGQNPKVGYVQNPKTEYRIQMWLVVQISRFVSDVKGSWCCCLYRCVCALLEGGEGLKEFGQVNL